MSAAKLWLFAVVWSALRGGQRWICPPPSNHSHQAALIITRAHTQDTSSQRTADIWTPEYCALCVCDHAFIFNTHLYCVFDVFLYMCVIICHTGMCACMCVCAFGRIPVLSGVLSSGPSDEFSTVAGGVTTPLYTGHTHWPPLWGFMGAKVLPWSDCVLYGLHLLCVYACLWWQIYHFYIIHMSALSTRANSPFWCLWI